MILTPFKPKQSLMNVLIPNHWTISKSTEYLFYQLCLADLLLINISNKYAWIFFSHITKQNADMQTHLFLIETLHVEFEVFTLSSRIPKIILIIKFLIRRIKKYVYLLSNLYKSFLQPSFIYVFISRYLFWVF